MAVDRWVPRQRCPRVAGHPPTHEHLQQAHASPFEGVVVKRAQPSLQPTLLQPTLTVRLGRWREVHRGAALEKSSYLGQRGQRLSIESHDHSPRMTAQAHLSLESRCLLQVHVSLEEAIA